MSAVPCSCLWCITCFGDNSTKSMNLLVSKLHPYFHQAIWTPFNMPLLAFPQCEHFMHCRKMIYSAWKVLAILGCQLIFFCIETALKLSHAPQWCFCTLGSQRHWEFKIMRSCGFAYVCMCTLHLPLRVPVPLPLHYITWHYIDQYCVALHYIPYDPNTMPYMYIHRMYYIASVALHRLRYITLSHTVPHRIASHQIKSLLYIFFITFTCTFTIKCTLACTITRHDITLHYLSIRYMTCHGITLLHDMTLYLSTYIQQM